MKRPNALALAAILLVGIATSSCCGSASKTRGPKTLKDFDQPLKYAKKAVVNDSLGFSIAIPKDWKGTSDHFWEQGGRKGDRQITILRHLYTDPEKSMKSDAIFHHAVDVRYSILDSGKTNVLYYPASYYHWKYPEFNKIEGLTFFVQGNDSTVFSLHMRGTQKQAKAGEFAIMLNCLKSFRIR